MAEIHDVKIQLAPEPRFPELLAYASLMYGDLCLRGIKIVRVRSGALRVNFPDTPVRVPCVACGLNVPITHAHCCHCGAAQPKRVPTQKVNGKPLLYQSVAFPVSHEARAEFERAILAAFDAEWSVARAAS
jgi:DNA-binding cell septation regulator SpoVG